MKHVITVVLLLLTNPARGGVVEFEDDFTGWAESVSSFSTITFAEVPFGFLAGDAYASLGVHFVDGSDVVFPLDTFSDGAGITGAPAVAEDIELVFDAPQYWIGADFIGAIAIRLYSEGILVFDSSVFGVSGPDHFGGLISLIGFDEARIRDPLDGVVFVDNLYFGVPAPGALGLLALAGALRTRQRR